MLFFSQVVFPKNDQICEKIFLGESNTFSPSSDNLTYNMMLSTYRRMKIGWTRWMWSHQNTKRRKLRLIRSRTQPAHWSNRGAGKQDKFYSSCESLVEYLSSQKNFIFHISPDFPKYSSVMEADHRRTAQSDKRWHILVCSQLSEQWAYIHRTALALCLFALFSIVHSIHIHNFIS